MTQNKVIITAALTGSVTPAGYDIPETPEQIAQAAYECWKLGAAVVHIHTRADDGLGCHEHGGVCGNRQTDSCL